MKAFISCLGFCLLISLASSEAVIKPTSPSLSERPRVLLVGDSLAVGLESECRTLARTYGYDVHVEARGGTRIDQWVRWLPAEILLYKPTVILVSLGTNDMAYYGGVRQHPELVDRIIEQAEQAHARLVWIGPPNFTPGRLPYDAEIRSILNQRVPLLFDSAPLPIEHTPDGVHLTPQGYRIWMDAVWVRVVHRKATQIY